MGLKNDIDVSISTINWNVSDKLISCIDSFLDTYDNLNYEWFIIDNISQDMDFDEIINRYSKYERIHFIKNDKNEGLAVLNKLLNKVQGRYWLFLDPDTLQKGKSITELIKFMDSTPEAGMASAIQLNVDGSPLLYYGRRFTLAKIFYTLTFIGKIIDHYLFSDKMHKYYYFENYDTSFLSQIDQVGFACTIERMELIQEDGYVIDPDLAFFFNDVDLCKRAWDKGYKIYLVPTAKIIHDWDSAYKKANSRWKETESSKCLIKYFKKHHRFKSKLLKILILSYTLISILLNINTVEEKWTRKEKIELFKKMLKW